MLQTRFSQYGSKKFLDLGMLLLGGATSRWKESVSGDLAGFKLDQSSISRCLS